jgi:hypothetical protein
MTRVEKAPFRRFSSPCSRSALLADPLQNHQEDQTSIRRTFLIPSRIQQGTNAPPESHVAQSLHGKGKDPSPGLLRRPPSPQGRGLELVISALSLGERVGRDRRFQQPARAG